jgi:8-oxo-dGTP pyrophosphatase MutT (NUDIX family)
MADLSERIVLGVMQRYWRWTRAATLGAQGMVLSPDRQVLLVRHGYRAGWHFPGGGVENGEPAGIAVLRELEEEVGVLAETPPEIFGIYTNFDRFPGDHIVLYRVTRWRRPRVPAPNREIVEQRFFPLDALPPGIAPGTARRIAELEGRAAVSHVW